jgi:tRNA U34 5-methylaminomethyl-2-thiouridine-forming methyltransferase MnmC
MTLRTVLTEDGSTTLFNSGLKEHYHSIHGAIQESGHIFMREGFDKIQAFPVSIFEAGFGTGLNAFLTFLASEGKAGSIFYTAIENYPVEEKITLSLNYPELINPAKAEVFRAMHNAPWNKEINLSRHFTLLKIKEDLCKIQLPETAYDLVYFDAFSPAVQPELWTEEIFRKLFTSMKAGAFLVTYSVKGSVTRALTTVGFIVEKLPGPPGKRAMTRATKPVN